MLYFINTISDPKKPKNAIGFHQQPHPINNCDTSSTTPSSNLHDAQQSTASNRQPTSSPVPGTNKSQPVAEPTESNSCTYRSPTTESHSTQALFKTASESTKAEDVKPEPNHKDPNKANPKSARPQLYIHTVMQIWSRFSKRYKYSFFISDLGEWVRILGIVGLNVNRGRRVEVKTEKGVLFGFNAAAPPSLTASRRPLLSCRRIWEQRVLFEREERNGEE